jgi:hypothetical protein
MDKLEPIRRVFRSAGLYNLAADDLLCQELAAVAAPQPQQPQAEPVGEWVMVPRTLTAENGAKAAFIGETFEGQSVPWTAVKAVHKAIVAWAEKQAQQPQAGTQASAEDFELVGVAIKEHAARYPGCKAENAWQRIRADHERMGVGRE